MNRRRRALIMLGGAIGAGVLAATLVGGYSSSVSSSYGELERVLILTRSLAQGQPISARVARASLESREVPSRFVPTGAIDEASDAVGLEPVGPMPAGSYLTAPSLRAPRKEGPARAAAGKGRHAVELSVSGGGALAGAGRVDVLVTTDDERGGGTTRVAAEKVPLIAVGPTGQSAAGPGLTQVTLGLTRSQALELVDAESFARRITVLPGTGP